MTQHRRLYILVLSSICLSCGTVKIRSTPPEADVLILLPGKAEPKQLGKTPFESQVNALSTEVNNGTIILIVQKQGYFPNHFIVPNLSGGELEIETSLKPNLHADYTEINRMVTLLFRAERMIKEKRFDDAIKAADELQAINENLAAAYHVKGTVFLLKNDLTKSRFEWKRAVELEPSNNEAQQMLKLIDQNLGVAPKPAETEKK
jgi:tetratricopeptide (TPR) repeat protein